MSKLTDINRLSTVLNENARLRSMSAAYGAEFEVLRCDLIEEAALRRLHEMSVYSPDPEVRDKAVRVIKDYV